MNDSPNLPAAACRMAIALVATLVLAAGAAAPHDVAVEPGTRASVEIATTAVHPGAPAHAEDAELEIHPACPACLLQILPGTALGRLPASPSLVVKGGELACRTERIPSREISLFGPARAPPTLPRSV